MIDTLGLPLKFVFHPVTNEGQRWYFDLTDVDKEGYVGLYGWDYESNKPLNERYSGWIIPEIKKFVSGGNWIIDFEVSDVCSPEVNDLL